MIDFFKIFLLVIPMYLANASAVLFKGNTRLDLGKNFFDNKPLFGSGKTLRGTIFASLTGGLCAVLISLFFSKDVSAYAANYVFVGFMLSTGAVFGDICASFLKRRLGLEQGKEFFPLDQLDFVIGGLFFANFFLTSQLNPSIEEIVLILIMTPIVHRIANYLAFRLKLKSVPW